MLSKKRGTLHIPFNKLYFTRIELNAVMGGEMLAFPENAVSAGIARNYIIHVVGVFYDYQRSCHLI